MKQERAVRTRQSLIRSAAEAFDRHGYLRARLSDISSSAGVTPGALHFHFENKAAVAATVEASAAVLLRRAAHDARGPRMNALQKLTGVSHALAGTLREDVVARAGYQLSCEGPHRAGLDLRGEWLACIHQLLVEADDEDLLTRDIPRQDIAASIAAATTGYEVLARSRPEWLAPATLARFWRFVLPRLATEEAQATVTTEVGGAEAGSPLWPGTEP